MEEGSRTLMSEIDGWAELIPAEGIGSGRGGTRDGAGNPKARPPGSFDMESLEGVMIESEPKVQMEMAGGDFEELVADENANSESLVEEQAESQSQELAAPSMPWGQLQDTILDALIADEDSWEGQAVSDLAKRLRSSVEELQQIMEASPADRWHVRRMEKLLELEQMRKRGFSWDRVEAAALHKLIGVVETKTLSIGELLQVARVANASTRRGFDPGGAPMTQNPPNAGGNQQNLQVNLYGQAVPGQQVQVDGLPGPGAIGTVTLQLTQRTIQQISRGREIDGESVRLSESIEMLTAEDVPQLSKMADGDIADG